MQKQNITAIYKDN